jgi:hypothetical protein
MKLTNIQRETIVKDIYNTIQEKQKQFIDTELDKNLAKKINEFKKTDDFKEFLKLEQLSNDTTIDIKLNKDHKFNTQIFGYNVSLKSLEKTVEFIYTKELKSTLILPNIQVIEDRLILSTIGGFDFEEFKKSILSDFGL